MFSHSTPAEMCRLFGMSAGSRRARATFWLLGAPDSLAAQSHREPDGTGLGWYDKHGAPQVRKQAIAAYGDAAFGREAREVSSSTFVAHIRFAFQTGALELRNTHPFEQDGRLLRAQRRDRGSAGARHPPRRCAGTRPRGHRLRAAVRADHPRDRRSRWRCRCGHCRRVRLGRGEPAAAGDQPDSRHRSGPVGVALSADARAAHPAARAPGAALEHSAASAAACTPSTARAGRSS